MTIAHTEYDREAFLDEYSPLCGNPASPRRNKIDFIRRRCFSELPMKTNNPLSKFRHPIRNKSSKQKHIEGSQNHIDRSLSAPSKNHDDQTERDSGYFSIAAEEQFDFSSFEKDMVPFLSDEDDFKEPEKLEKASTFVKRRTKFLLYKRNLKLSIGKEKQKSTKPNSPTMQQSSPTLSASEETNERNTPRSKKLLWRKALKQASMVVRFIRRETKNDDEMSLVREASIRRHQEVSMTTSEDEPEHTNTDESLEEENTLKHDQLCFDDSFVKETSGNSPMSAMYLPPARKRRLSRPRPRSLFSSSVSYLPGLPVANETSTNNNNDFIAKYLNKSKSLEDIFQLSNDADSDEHRDLFVGDTPDKSIGLFPNDDFKPDSTVYCLPKNEFKSRSSKLDIKEPAKRHYRKDGLTKGDFETIIEEEVDNYIRNDCQKNERSDSMFTYEHDEFSCSNIKHTSTLSYSVNDLYDLLNRNNIFNVEYGLDLLI